MHGIVMNHEKSGVIATSSVGRRDGSSYYGTMSQECSDFFYAFRDKAIAEDKRKRLIKATMDAFEQQIASENIRPN